VVRFRTGHQAPFDCQLTDSEIQGRHEGEGIRELVRRYDALVDQILAKQANVRWREFVPQ
jgi:hypothetical protein